MTPDQAKQAVLRMYRQAREQPRAPAMAMWNVRASLALEVARHVARNQYIPPDVVARFEAADDYFRDVLGKGTYWWRMWRPGR